MRSGANRLSQIFHAGAFINRDDIGARDHDVLDTLVAHGADVGEKRPLVGGDALIGRPGAVFVPIVAAKSEKTGQKAVLSLRFAVFAVFAVGRRSGASFVVHLFRSSRGSPRGVYNQASGV